MHRRYVCCGRFVVCVGKGSVLVNLLKTAQVKDDFRKGGSFQASQPSKVTGPSGQRDGDGAEDATDPFLVRVLFLWKMRLLT